MEWWYFWRFVALSELRHFRNPFRRFQKYEKSRGMSLWTDIRDWLGGWPMEFAGILETRTFCRDHLGLKLLWMSAGEACTEYLFSHQQDASQAQAAEIQEVQLPGPFRHQTKFAFVTRLPQLPDDRAINSPSTQSQWVLFEDEEPLTFPRAKKKAIAVQGGGRYQISGTEIRFSSSDGTDPNVNGRTYRLRRRISSPLAPPARPVNIS